MRHTWLGMAALLGLMALTGTACERHGGTHHEGTGAAPTGPRPRPIPEQVQAECNNYCWRALPAVGTLLRLAVRSVRYGDRNDIDVLNLRGEPRTFDGWVAATGDAQEPMPTGITVAPQEVLHLHLGRQGTSTGAEAYLPDLHLGPEGEFALFMSSNFSSSNIALYVRWGSDPTGTTYMPMAAQAEFWPARGYVPVCPGYTGFVAVGDVGLPRGFRSVPDSCWQTAEVPPMNRPY